MPAWNLSMYKSTECGLVTRHNPPLSPGWKGIFPQRKLKNDSKNWALDFYNPRQVKTCHYQMHRSSANAAWCHNASLDLMPQSKKLEVFYSSFCPTKTSWR